MQLLDLRNEARRRSDMENSQFVSDTELTSYINNSYAELYDLLVSRFEDYYSKLNSFTLSSTNTTTLPSDFYKVRGLDFQLSTSEWVNVPKWQFENRNSFTGTAFRFAGVTSRCYRVMGQTLYVLPSDQAQGSYQMWYIPRVTKLVNDSDVLSDILDFDEYIIVDSAIKCLIKEESDPSVLLSIKEGLKQRVLAMSANRDSQPERIVDVCSNSSLGW